MAEQRELLVKRRDLKGEQERILDALLLFGTVLNTMTQSNTRRKGSVGLYISIKKSQGRYSKQNPGGRN